MVEMDLALLQREQVVEKAEVFVEVEYSTVEAERPFLEKEQVDQVFN
jgi:hypothetical protein